MKSTVDELIDELYEMVDRAWSLPLSGGRAVLDGEEVKQILDEIREALPQESRQARAIVADRNQIIADARKEAEDIVRRAEERAKTMIHHDEIVKQAQAQANEIITQANAKSRERLRVTNEYVDNLMRRTDEALSENLAELRNARKGIKAAQRSGQ